VKTQEDCSARHGARMRRRRNDSDPLRPLHPCCDSFSVLWDREMCLLPSASRLPARIVGPALLAEARGLDRFTGKSRSACDVWGALSPAPGLAIDPGRSRHRKRGRYVPRRTRTRQDSTTRLDQRVGVEGLEAPPPRPLGRGRARDHRLCDATPRDSDDRGHRVLAVVSVSGVGGRATSSLRRWLESVGRSVESSGSRCRRSQDIGMDTWPGPTGPTAKYRWG